MNDYSKYTDEELITLYREGEKEISEYLVVKYKPLVLKIVKSMFILGGDSDDLIQEGMIGLYKAIGDYDAGRDASFRTFANLCVSRGIYNAITASQSQKHRPLNEYVSIYSETHSGGEESEGEGGTLENILSDVTDKNPEELLMNKELKAEVEDFMNKSMSTMERDVFQLSLAGYKLSSIAKVLSIDEKSADNALSRAKGKLKKEFSRT